MQTVGQLISRVMPRGTQGPAARQGGRVAESKPTPWLNVPAWPADVFAAAATLVSCSECYAHPSVRGGTGLGTNHSSSVRRHGRRWARDLNNPAARQWGQVEWDALVAAWDDDVGDAIDKNGRLRRWALAALRLLALSDEACAGVGFGSSSTVTKLAEVFALRNDGCTLTWLVDPAECCVQPKGRTPPVGCNLRSLSLHLALLPSANKVRSAHLDPGPLPSRKKLGVMLVPFPYSIPNSDFRHQAVHGQHWGHLRLRCSWTSRPGPKQMAEFVAALVIEARKHDRQTDIVVLPELALSSRQYAAVWARLRRMGVFMLISGVHRRTASGSRNVAMGSLTRPGAGRAGDLSWKQSKHHRWRVERWQVKNYGLPLDPKKSWWEDVEVHRRTVVTARFTAGSTVACLVCEDLARVEPVQPVLREMGPSLLVALLMDGPQADRRWSAKSSTVFADDPGCSVLTLTSLALVRRSQLHRDGHSGSASPPIALWQQPDDQPREIPIRPDAHAVHFPVRVEARREVTLDGRRDGGAAEVLVLDLKPKGDAKRLFLSIVAPSAPEWASPLYRAAEL